MHMYFPKNKNVNVTKLIKKAETPNKLWPLYTVKVLKRGISSKYIFNYL